jgi:hypothetical protein
LARTIERLPGEKQLWCVSTDNQGNRNKWQRDTPDFVTKSVCKHCNEGWMSDLEKTVEPILKPMIGGKKTTLTDKQQHAIGVWLVKTTMVLNSTIPKSSFYKESELFHFRETRLPAGHVTFCLGHYAEAKWSGFTNHRILHNHRYIPYYSCYIVTMAFGQLVLQLCNYKSSPPSDIEFPIVVKEGPWSLVEFTTHFPKSVRWPPPGKPFDDSKRTLQEFSKRFGGSDSM